MIREVKCPNGIEVYDRGIDYMDRFTIFMPDGEVFCMSTNACSPLGVCRYEGTRKQVVLTDADVRRDMVPVHVARKINDLRV